MANSIIEKIEAEIEISEAKLNKKKRIIELFKYIIVGLILLAEVFVLGTQMYNRFIPNNQYKEAVSLYNEGKVEEALPIFKKLGEHRNSEYYCDLIYSDNPLLRFDNCKVGDELRFGRYKGDNIDWVVISASKNKVLLISKNIIDSSAFPDESWFDEFLNTSYKTKEKELIEKAYILSVDDADDYLAGKAFAKTKPTQQALLNRDYKRNSEFGYGWWLSTSAYSGYKHRVAGDDGHIGYNSYDDSYVSGIRPALSVLINS